MNQWFTYRAKPDHDSTHPYGVVDGDTIDVVIDQGFSTYRRERLRLKAIDTAEIYGASDDRGTATEQRQFVIDWLAEATGTDAPEWPLAVTTEETGKYGRYVAEVIRRIDGESLTYALVREYPEIDE